MCRSTPGALEEGGPGGVCVPNSDAGPAACSQRADDDEAVEMNRWYYVAVF